MKKRVGPLWRKIVLAMGQKAGKCKKAVELGMVGSLNGMGVVVRFLEMNAWGAWRRGPGKVCRNSFTGLVMLPGLELWTSFALRAGDGREANDARLSQTADSPCPDHADALEAMRKDG